MQEDSFVVVDDEDTICDNYSAKVEEYTKAKCDWRTELVAMKLKRQKITAKYLAEKPLPPTRMYVTEEAVNVAVYQGQPIRITWSELERSDRDIILSLFALAQHEWFDRYACRDFINTVLFHDEERRRKNSAAKTKKD